MTSEHPVAKENKYYNIIKLVDTHNQCSFHPNEADTMTKKVQRRNTEDKPSHFEFTLGDVKLDETVLHMILEHSHDAVLIVGMDYKFEYVSEEGYKMVNAKAGELIGLDFREYMPDEMARKEVVQRLRDMLAGKDVSPSYSTKILDTDGNILHVDIRIVLIRDINDQPKALVLVHDRTEERLSQVALEESEYRYRSLVESMNDGLAVDTPDMILTYANDAFCQMLEYTRDEIVGRCWLDFTTADRDEMEERIRQREEGQSERYELEWITKSGRAVYTLVSAVPLFDRSGEFKGTFGVVTDITTQKEYEDTIQFYLDLLTHDIANQLQVIMTAVGLLDQDLPKQYLDDARQDITDAIQRCDRLITKVKRAGQTRYLPLTRMDLATVIKEKAAVLQRVYSTEVTLKGMNGASMVWADALLGEMVWNLLENAARHNPSKKRRVWISTSRKNGNLQLVISDNGPGISDSKKKTLFQKMQRSGGVGLTLVSQMIRKYGGTIEVNDRVKGSPSKGAKFIITLKPAE